MKVTVKEKNEKREIKFPCLMVSGIGTIIYFTEKKVGIAIAGLMKGCYSENWRMNHFNPFNGEITLSND